MTELFDTHCHLDEAQFDSDRTAVHERMLEAGITNYAVIGTDLESSKHVLDYTSDREGAYAVIGFHPSEADRFKSSSDLVALSELSRHNPKVKAIGEIGLDYHWDDNPPHEIQKRVCEEQMELAWELGLPCVFHVRDAHQDMIDLLKDHKNHQPGGIIHCFSGSWEMAKEYMKLGYYISFAGPLTFKKAPKLQETAARMPEDRILIETDSPYMAPEPMRGRRNEPAYVQYVCRKLAELRNRSYEDMAAITLANARRVYQIG